jgi:hypothetical protein
MGERDVVQLNGEQERAESCPAGTVDERAARIVAGLTVVIASASLFEPAMWLMGLLAVDFAIRAWGDRRFSPLRWVAKKVTSGLGLEPKPVYAPPKRFAARIGSTITLSAALLHLAGAHEVALGVTVMLIAAASLEAVAAFCVACWIYPHVHRTRVA